MRDPQLDVPIGRSYDPGNVNGRAPRQRPRPGHGGVGSMSIKQATPKRVRVFPNLYQRPADGRYEAGYTGSDGRWRIQTLAARTLTEAKAELRQLLGKRDQREDVASSRLT